VLDFILTGGLIVDGTGKPGFVTDVAIAGDVIARVGDCSELAARERVGCAGAVVAPGFIDMHGHSDEVLLVNPLASSKLRQGITTEVGGNCGTSPAPLSHREQVDRALRLQTRHGLELSWTDFDGFFAALERAGCALNFCCLVGLGNTRDAVDGISPRPLDAGALERECSLVREACAQGAIGVSSGLMYPPGCFADAEELTALARAAGDAGGAFYATHLRSEGDQLEAAVEEALAVGRRAEASVQFSHHKAAGQKNWGKVHRTLALIDKAKSRGMDVGLDQYPYKASSTGLDAILPEDVKAGTRDDVIARLADARYAAALAARLEFEWGGRWNDIVISTVSTSRNRNVEGRSIAQIAAARGRPPAATVLRMLVEERLDVSAIYFTMCESDVRAVLSYGSTCIGSDAAARATSGPTSAGRPHPRAFGTFPRVFRRYVRETALLTLEEAVRRSTWLPATRLRLRRRGKVAEGWYGDIAVFDPQRIGDTATYVEPLCYPVGVRHVFVNGRPAVRDEATTGEMPGRVLRRGRDL